MKVTIINNDKGEKKYTREELDEFVAQLKDGTFHQHYVCDFSEGVKAVWQKGFKP